MQETWVRSLGQDDPLEKEMAVHASILAWRIPRMEEPGRLQSMGSQRVGHDCGTNTHTHKDVWATFITWTRLWGQRHTGSRTPRAIRILSPYELCDPEIQFLH